MKSMGVGVIGCGARAKSVLQHCVLPIAKDVKVKAVCDPLAASVADCVKTFGEDVRVYADYRELVKAPDIAWVFVGSWNCFHREHAVAAMEAGKDVFCEKPLATTLEDCVAMRDAQRRTGRKFVIGFTLRYSPHYRKVKELLTANAIGDIISFEFNETLGFAHGGFIHADWRRHTKNAGTHLLEKCCHDIDLANWFMNGAKAARAASFGGVNFFLPKNAQRLAELGKTKDGRDAYLAWPFRSEHSDSPFSEDKDIVDNQVAIIEYDNQVRATFHANCNTAIPERRMYFCGTHGTLRADAITGKIELKRVGLNEELQNLDAGVSGGHAGGDSILGREVVDCMIHGAAPFSTLEDGLKSAITCFAIDDAMKAGKVIDLAPYWEKAGLK